MKKFQNSNKRQKVISNNMFTSWLANKRPKLQISESITSTTTTKTITHTSIVELISKGRESAKMPVRYRMCRFKFGMCRDVQDQKSLVINVFINIYRLNF